MIASGYTTTTPCQPVLKACSAHIVDRANIILASNSIGAVGRLQATMEGIKLEDESIGDRQLRYEAAKEILDRVGIHKKVGSMDGNINVNVPIAVVLLPSKDTTTPLPEDINPIEATFEEV